MRSRMAGLVLAGLVFVSLGALSACADDTEAKPGDADPSGSVVRELAARYGAVTGWEEGLFYTAQAQQRLLTSQPVLFIGQVDDVFYRSETIIVRFSLSAADFLSNYFVFELECSPSIAETIFAETATASDLYYGWNEYVVVADVQEVSKPVIGIGPSAISEDEAEIDLYPSSLFIAKGRCIDVARVGEE